MPTSLTLADLPADVRARLVQEIVSLGLHKPPKPAKKPPALCVRSPFTGACTRCGHERAAGERAECGGAGAFAPLVSGAHIRSIVNR